MQAITIRTLLGSCMCAAVLAAAAITTCLAQGPDKKWILTNASEPAATKDETSTPASLQAAQSTPLGSQILELVSVSPSFKPDSHRTHKVEVRGLLYRDPKYVELNLTSLDTVASSCAN